MSVNAQDVSNVNASVSATPLQVQAKSAVGAKRPGTAVKEKRKLDDVDSSYYSINSSSDEEEDCSNKVGSSAPKAPASHKTKVSPVSKKTRASSISSLQANTGANGKPDSTPAVPGSTKTASGRAVKAASGAENREVSAEASPKPKGGDSVESETGAAASLVAAAEDSKNIGFNWGEGGGGGGASDAFWKNANVDDFNVTGFEFDSSGSALGTDGGSGATTFFDSGFGDGDFGFGGSSTSAESSKAQSAVVSSFFESTPPEKAETAKPATSKLAAAAAAASTTTTSQPKASDSSSKAVSSNVHSDASKTVNEANAKSTADDAKSATEKPDAKPASHKADEEDHSNNHHPDTSDDDSTAALGPWEETTGEEHEDTISKHTAHVWKAVLCQVVAPAENADFLGSTPVAAGESPAPLSSHSPGTSLATPAAADSVQGESASTKVSVTETETLISAQQSSEARAPDGSTNAVVKEPTEKVGAESPASVSGGSVATKAAPAATSSGPSMRVPNSSSLVEVPAPAPSPIPAVRPRYKYKDVGFGPLKINIPKTASSGVFDVAAPPASGWRGPRLIMRMASSVGSTFGTKLLLNVPLLEHVQVKRIDCKKLAFTCFQRFTDEGASIGLERFKFRFDTERACTETLDAILKHRAKPSSASP